MRTSIRFLLPLCGLFLAVALAGCSGAPVKVEAVEQPRGNTGIDLPTDASDVLNELKEKRLGFVARYYRNPASRWPTLSASEAQRLSSLGFNIVAVWEWHSHDPAYFSQASGYGDAVMAYTQAQKLGQPPGSAIYFAVDFDAQGQALESALDYFRGVKAALAAA